MGILDIAGQIDTVADWTANPPPNKPIAKAVGSAMQKVCNSFGNAPDWAKEALAATPGGAQGIPGTLGIACKPYWDSQGRSAPSFEPPFTGGQCSGVSYDVKFNSRRANLLVCSTGATAVSNAGADNRVGGRSFTGPISSMNVRLTGPERCGFTTASLEIVHAGGTFTTGITNVPAGNPTLITSVFLAGLRAERVGGGAECGDPPAELKPGPNPPPNPGPLAAGETPTFDPSNPTGAPIPFPDIPSIPGLPALPIPDDAFDPGGGPQPAAGGDGLPGDPDAIAPDAGEVTGDGDGEEVSFGDPPPGKVWVGCVARVTASDSIGNIAGTSPQSTVFPTVVGNLALKHGSFYSASVPIRSKFQDLFRKNSALIVTGCFIHARPGVTISVAPVSAATCPDNPCGD